MKNATAQVVKFPSQNGNGRPGTPGYRWSPAQHRKFVATMRAKRKEKARAARELRERAKPRGRPKAAPRSREERTEDRIDRFVAAIGRNRKAATPRSGRSAGAERADAIVYLTAATADVGHVSNAELLALLALRRLRGEIK